MLERAETVIEWWASRDTSDPGRRPYAVVFGDRALCIGEPRLNTEHRPVYSFKAYELDPSSFRRLKVDHRPPPGPSLGTASTRGQATSSSRPTSNGPGPGGAEAGPDLGLGSVARGLLGNLPPQAQELLQAPFPAGQRVLRCDWHYESHEHHLKMFMVYLAGAKNVTVAHGTKIVPAGHTDATAHWALECRRATVTRRVGT